MRGYIGRYACKECLHGLTGSCTDELLNGCEYFFNAITGRRFEKIDIRGKTG